MDIATLKSQGKITREHISQLLASIAPPGEKQDEKIEAVEKLGLTNFQGHNVSVTLPSYKEY
jgi:hypothetical protein